MCNLKHVLCSSTRDQHGTQAADALTLAIRLRCMPKIDQLQNIQQLKHIQPTFALLCVKDSNSVLVLWLQVLLHQPVHAASLHPVLSPPAQLPALQAL